MTKVILFCATSVALTLGAANAYAASNARSVLSDRQNSHFSAMYNPEAKSLATEWRKYRGSAFTPEQDEDYAGREP
jgi:hypothetical protein